MKEKQQRNRFYKRVERKRKRERGREQKLKNIENEKE